MGYSECVNCGCFKQANPFIVGTRAYPNYTYYRDGVILSALPECKSTFHNDVMPRKEINP